ncbi:cysteine-rich protein 1 isoform X5 [Salmo salar]|uniref:Cysteine-rich protein 1-like isoform X1 n=1 Tax=Salmo salar TaxID=8030 RepID=A0ABM3E825_SALSA|nr:cysteine-rich protein 1-like isoform X1 [Salmo salar]XP_045568450.1 cysteine-rich protein 1-like isoform X5 [Salmo salar]
MVGYCPICGKPVYFGEKKRSLGRDYHPLCLKCQQCQRQLTPGQHAEHDEKPYCTNCYMKMFGTRGTSPRNQSNQKPPKYNLMRTNSLSTRIYVQQT